MVVQHNISASNASRMLNITNSSIGKTQEELSSGYRINRSADDAAGLSISEKMRKQINGLGRASTNIEDGISLVQIADGALTETHDMLQRMNELCVQAANGTNTDSDRMDIQYEINQLRDEIDRIAKTTSFNNKIFPLNADTYIKEIGSTAIQKVPAQVGLCDFQLINDFGGEITINGVNYGTNDVTIEDAIYDKYYNINTDNIFPARVYFSGTYTLKDGTVIADGWGQLIHGTSGSVSSILLDAYPSLNMNDVASIDFYTPVAKNLHTNDEDYLYFGTYRRNENSDNDLDKMFLTSKGHLEPRFVEGFQYTAPWMAGNKLTDYAFAAVEEKFDLEFLKYKPDEEKTITFGHIDGVGNDRLFLQSTNEANEGITVQGVNATAKALGVEKLDITTEDTATASIDIVGAAIMRVSEMRSYFGAIQNRLEHSVKNVDNIVENTTAAESRIRDTDMATTMVDFSKNNILQQAGQSMLAQANTDTQSVLSLLQ